ncbi:MAG TPA: thioredoxin-like domain-containing protein [Acidobacteriota bacterium]|mgnify:CR=1 FL=1|nr:thioredoxin-like domain-containing protein [Acidobacteriota bacterium]
MSGFPTRPEAPDFPPDAEWLNVTRPLHVSELSGHVVVLCFWSYSSIECLSVLPLLQALQKRHPKRVLVIGIHCAKFPAQRGLRHLQNIAWQYDLRHPLLNDYAFEAWKAYSVREWPTFVLLDDAGRIASYYSGIENVGFVMHQVDRLAQEAQRDPTSLNGIRPRRRNRRFGPLSYPSVVLADPRSNRLFVTDTGRHQILILDLNGKRLDTIGRGCPGRQDGTFEQAALRWPRGLSLDGEYLYIADTGNHLLRRCNLKKRIVSTVAGTGERAITPGEFSPRKPLHTSLSSPWGLCRLQRSLFITMPGVNQIWLFDLATQEVGAFAGIGFPGRIDASGYQAAFATPTAITSDRNCLYVTDSEGSAIRRISIEVHPRVDTIVGLDPFEFGDEDGPAEGARIQHPSGIAYAGRRLFVSDSYNHKIKTISLEGERAIVQTRFGSGRAAYRDGDRASFDHPGGLSCAGYRLFIADTHNHAVRIAELRSGLVSTLKIE